MSSETYQKMLWLMEEYPLAFRKDHKSVRPLIPCLYVDIARDRNIAQGSEEFKLIKRAVSMYSRRPSYLFMLAQGKKLRDLSGKKVKASSFNARKAARDILISQNRWSLRHDKIFWHSLESSIVKDSLALPPYISD